jgi:hypothetical protein
MEAWLHFRPGTAAVSLELSCDTTILALALLEERAKKPLMRKRWYGGSSTLYLDYPLTITAPHFVRIWP